MSEYTMLDRIKCPADLNELNKTELEQLCADIRRFLINNVCETGGHLASNLGVVELTVALHLEYDTSRDRIVFDVGHQSYVHKLLTGRRDGFAALRQFGGMSGFPRPDESRHDAFVTGHASTSVSVATGMARARTLLGDDYSVVAVIGDGALSGGMAYEALNDAGRSGEPMIVILNDNDMSISPSVGALAKYLSRMRLRPAYSRAKIKTKKIFSRLPGGDKTIRRIHGYKQKLRRRLLPGSFFEDMGFTYLGPTDGHDIDGIRRTIRYAREQDCPALIHLKTIKGKGYRFSQENPEAFHGMPRFNPSTGKPIGVKTETYSNVFGKQMCSLAAADERVVAITAAMRDGTGLEKFAGRFPRRFFDVGIAEEHAVTMAAGMAMQGLIPVCAIYSTFLQRSYDQLIHDVAIQGLHVVFAVDRAGITGEDGETHQGVFDAAFLSTVPGMTILCPEGEKELRAALRRAVCEEKGPVAVRYPRGAAYSQIDESSRPATLTEEKNARVTIVSYGSVMENVRAAKEILHDRGIDCDLVKLYEIKPLPFEIVERSARRTGVLLSVEDSVREGGVGQRLAAALAGENIKIKRIDADDGLIPCGCPKKLYEYLGLDAAAIARAAEELLNE